MKTFIEIKFINDATKAEDVYTVVLNNDELLNVVRTGGLNAANKALDSFVNRFIGQFKQKLSDFINK